MPSINTAQGHLRKPCAEYAVKYGYKESEFSRGLESYAAHLFAQEDGFNALLEGRPTFEEDLSEFICRDHDLGIDVVLEDETNKRFILVQAAWRKKLEEDKVSAFFDAPARIISPGYSITGGEQIQYLLAGFEEKLADGYEVWLRFVTNVAVGGNDRLQELVQSKNQDYQDADKAITCELFGPAELMKKQSELASAYHGGFVTEVTLNLPAGQFIELDAPYRTIIGVIKANELVDLYNRKEVQNKLFNLNIRLPLTSRKVNPQMVETAIDDKESKHFLYYNNGVSGVCSSYERDGNKLTIHRFQIINGAQTVSALVTARRRKKADANVLVLFRLTETIESYGGLFTENIIRYNNTQNPVKVSDFFSNDEIQEWLRDNLKNVAGKGPIPNMYYVHKSGYKPAGATGRGLRMEQMAGIRHAFLRGPVASYKEPQQFFDKSLRYWEAFGTDAGEPATKWNEEELARAAAAVAIHDRVQQHGKRLKADEKTKEFDEAKYLYRLARYVTGLVGVGLETTRTETFNDYKTLIASTPTFNKYVDPMIATARQLLRWHWADFKEKKRGVQPEYNLARDEDAWISLSGRMKQEAIATLVQ